MSVTRRTLASLFVLIVTVAGTACTSTKEVEKIEGSPIAEDACFNVRDVRSFDAIHDRFVYVRCLRGKHYLLTMDNACQGLQNSLAVAVSSGFNRVCSYDRARLTYRNFNRTFHCGILRVEAVDDRAAAADLVKRRTKPETETEE
jgi:hypothetical protein